MALKRGAIPALAGITTIVVATPVAITAYSAVLPITRAKAARHVQAAAAREISPLRLSTLDANASFSATAALAVESCIARGARFMLAIIAEPARATQEKAIRSRCAHAAGPHRAAAALIPVLPSWAIRRTIG